MCENMPYKLKNLYMELLKGNGRVDFVEQYKGMYILYMDWVSKRVDGVLYHTWYVLGS